MRSAPPPITRLGSRPRDLRGSYITLRLYEGIPLTTISREVGTSVQMLDRHYAGVIANWKGSQIPADDQISAARGRLVDVGADPAASDELPNGSENTKDPANARSFDQALHRTRTGDPFLTIEILPGGARCRQVLRGQLPAELAGAECDAEVLGVVGVLLRALPRGHV